MLRFILVRAFAAAVALTVFLAALLGAAGPAFGAEPPRPVRPAGATCTETVRVRPSDGALVTHWVCEVPSGPRPAPR